MRKFWRKTLVFLLAVGMLCPTWIAAGVSKTIKVKAAGETLSSLSETNDLVGEDEWSDSYDFETGIKLEDGNLSEAFVEDETDLELDYNGQEEVSFLSSETIKQQGLPIIENSVSEALSPEKTQQKNWSSKHRPIILKKDPNKESSQDYQLYVYYKDGLKLYKYSIINTENDEKVESGSIKKDFESCVRNGKYKCKTITTSTEGLKDGTYELRVFAKIGKKIVKKTIKFTIDKIAPVITLNGEDNLKVEQYSVYTDAGATAFDNIDGDITNKIVDTVNEVNTSEVKTYTITYNVSDAAGNEAEQKTRTVEVIAKETEEAIPSVLPVSPDFTVTQLAQKSFLVEWEDSGAEAYIIEINGNTPLPEISAGSEKYSQEIVVENYGTYEVSVIAKIGEIKAEAYFTKSITLKAPATTPTTSGIVTRSTAATVGPTKAEAAAPSDAETTPVVSESSDDQDGKIKGDESSNDNTDNNVNWTPWIVLFILIILAGAATGGYFYWFAGEEEVSTVVKEAGKTEKRVAESKKAQQSKPKPNKKSKRW